MKLLGQETIRYKIILIELFKRFTSFCEENHICYYCAYGTALGVVRHKGLIPWDDDIDVYMPRPDYVRFIAIAHRIEDTFIMTPEKDKFYHLYFAKLCDANTTIITYRGSKCSMGIFIDIFMLNGAPEKGKERDIMIKKINRAIINLGRTGTSQNPIVILQELKNKHILKAIHKLYLFCFGKNIKKNSLRTINYYINKYPYESCKYVFDYGENYNGIFPKKWFGKRVKGYFEGIEVSLPCEWNSYLKHLYNNYLELPPLENRVSNHDEAYINLDRHESYKEIIII